MTTHQEAQRAALREEIEDAAYHYSKYIVEDTAHTTLVEHMLTAFDAFFTTQPSEQSAKAAVPLTSLTDEQVNDILSSCSEDPALARASDIDVFKAIVRATEAAHGITTSTHPEASKQEAQGGRVAYADKINFEHGMLSGKGCTVWPCDVWPTPGDYEAETGRKLIALYLAATPKPQAEPAKLPTIPDSVLAYVHAYGDSRADEDGLSGVRIGEAILAVRRWAATLAQPQSEPAPSAAAKGWSDAYDRVDRFLRNNTDDASYAEFSRDLETVLAAHPTPDAPQADALDAARLNALAVNMWFVEPQYSDDTWKVGKANDRGVPAHSGATLRKAIDAAMAAQKGEAA